MKNKIGFWKRVKFFIKRNIYSVVVGACMVMIVTSLAITAVIKFTTQKNDTIFDDIIINSEIPVNAYDPIVFISPLAEYTLATAYASNYLLYNETLDEWATHLGIDLIAPSGTSVVAVYDGVIESINYTILDGTIITIKHTDNLKTVYKSLSSEVAVTEGQKIAKGQAIGSVSDSATSESKLGAHLHFEVFKDGVNVDPLEFLSLTSK